MKSKTRLFAGCAIVATVYAFSASAKDFAPVNTDPPGFGFDSATTFDILGIKPGDTLDDARNKIKSTMNKETRDVKYSANVSNNKGAQVAINFISEIKLKSDSGLNPMYDQGKSVDKITVYVASSIYDNRVLGIRRRISFGPGQLISADAMRLQVEEKYGKPTSVKRGYSGSAEQLIYVYSNGKLLSQGDYAPTMQSGVHGGNSPTTEYSEYSDTWVSDGRTITAKIPCAGFVFGGVNHLEYDFNDKIRIVDDKCSGMFRVNLNGPPAGLNDVNFELVDTKRTYGFRKAFDKAILDELSNNSTRADTPKPKL